MSEQQTARSRARLADLQQIDVLCDRFEVAWRSGQQPDIAEFLAEVPANVRPQLFCDLLSLELEYRSGLGEQMEARSYCQRFPEFALAVGLAFKARSSDTTQLRDDENEPG